MRCIYRLVQVVDGTMIASDFNPDNVVPAMSVRGHEVTGQMSRKGVRPELLGQPKFSGVNGPMWGGVENGVPVIRYESVEAYAELST